MHLKFALLLLLQAQLLTACSSIDIKEHTSISDLGMEAILATSEQDTINNIGEAVFSPLSDSGTVKYVDDYAYIYISNQQYGSFDLQPLEMICDGENAEWLQVKGKRTKNKGTWAFCSKNDHVLFSLRTWIDRSPDASSSGTFYKTKTFAPVNGKTSKLLQDNYSYFKSQVRFAREAKQELAERIMRERKSKEHLLAVIGTRICREQDKLSYIGYIERVESHNIQIRVADRFYTSSPRVRPGSFKEHIIWDTPQNWYVCN
ncbi:hypothetical protein A3749_09485 [Oleiphilus sp. HI0078]|nr:hypothetical protein A3743_14155 [Oleiphilus sp. HI0072]KZZ11206.1 hypothetical protein A3749_09485 [Oleiphilus sp. HI0078]